MVYMRFVKHPFKSSSGLVKWADDALNITGPTRLFDFASPLSADSDNLPPIQRQDSHKHSLYMILPDF